MTVSRTRYTAKFKAKVAIEAIRQRKTINEITSEYGIHATQVNTWKSLAMNSISEALSYRSEKQQTNRQAEIDELHRQIGQLTAERDWLKKKSLNSRLK